MVQNLTKREAEFNRFIRLMNQLVIAADNSGGEENLSPVQIQIMSKEIDDQFKLAHKVIDVVDQANRKTCVTLLQYYVEKPDSPYAQNRLFTNKKEEEKFQQIVYVNLKFVFEICVYVKLEEFIYLLHVMDSVYDKNHY